MSQPRPRGGQRKTEAASSPELQKPCISYRMSACTRAASSSLLRKHEAVRFNAGTSVTQDPDRENDRDSPRLPCAVCRTGDQLVACQQQAPHTVRCPRQNCLEQQAGHLRNHRHCCHLNSGEHRQCHRLADISRTADTTQPAHSYRWDSGSFGRSTVTEGASLLARDADAQRQSTMGSPEHTAQHTRTLPTV